VTRRRPAGDAGALAVELVVIIPAILLLLALVYAYGRVAAVNGTFEAGVRDAARAATQARSAEQARDVARASLERALATGFGPCLDSLEVVVPAPYQAGFVVTVEASCRYPLRDIGVPGAPGTVRLESAFSSPLDPNRRVEGGAP
jgi:hypothetical protein